MIVVLALVGVVIVILVYALKTSPLPANTRAIPHAPGWWASQAMALLTQPPWDVMEEWVTAAKGITQFSLGGTTYVVVGTAQAARHVMAVRLKNYIKDQASYAVFGDVLGSGLVTSEGHVWRRQRALVAPVFKRDMLKAVIPLAWGGARRVALALQVARDAAVPCDVAEELRHVTLQVIGEAVLSLSPKQSDDVLPALYLPVVSEANVRTWYPFRRWLPLPATFRYNACVVALNAFVSDLVQDRARSKHASPEESAASADSGDILDQLLCSSIQQGDDVLNDKESLRQMRDEIKTFLLAGHETSSMMLAWALYELSKDEKALARVRKEAASLPALATTDLHELPTAEELKSSLTFTEAVLKETLRLYSIVPIVSRQAVDDDVLDGFHIPAGTKLFVHIQAIHRDPALWPNPDVFDPERFIGMDTLNPKEHRYAFLPFIQGGRSCIGQFFSLLESKIMLALLVRDLDFTMALPASQAGERHPYVLPYAPKHGLMVHTVPRNQ